jgi:hypothetical protein
LRTSEFWPAIHHESRRMVRTLPWIRLYKFRSSQEHHLHVFSNHINHQTPSDHLGLGFDSHIHVGRPWISILHEHVPPLQERFLFLGTSARLESNDRNAREWAVLFVKSPLWSIVGGCREHRGRCLFQK